MFLIIFFITHIYYYYIKYSKYLIICIFSRKRKSLKENIQLRLGFEKHLGSKKKNISYWPSYLKVININIIISLMWTIIGISHFIILWKVFVINLIISLTFPSTWKFILLKKLYFMCNMFQILSARYIQQANWLAF